METPEVRPNIKTVEIKIESPATPPSDTTICSRCNSESKLTVEDWNNPLLEYGLIIRFKNMYQYFCDSCGFKMGIPDRIQAHEIGNRMATILNRLGEYT